MSRDLAGISQKLQAYGLKKLCNTHFADLCEDTDPVAFGKVLRANGVITPSHYEAALAEPTTNDKNYKLYELVAKRARHASVLLQALEDSGNSHIIDIIEDIVKNTSAGYGTDGGNAGDAGGMDRTAYLEGVIARLHERLRTYGGYHDLPLEEFFRPHLSKLYAKTGAGVNDLMQRLFEAGVIKSDFIEEVNAERTSTARCARVYRVVSQKEAVRPLIIALEKSNNGHVVDLINSWL